MTTQNRFFNRPRLWGLILAVVPLLSLARFDTAHAAPTCTTSDQQVTCTFNFTGAPETWTVPDGVTQATFEVYGAQGGDILTFNGFLIEGGGRGGMATATLTVQPNATYQINVGGRGELRRLGAGVGGAGGYNGGGPGGNSNQATGGGGASDIRTGSFSLTERVIVAGGGGGIGDACGSIPGGNGGAGGGDNGGAGFAGYNGAPGGGGGTQIAGGQGGDPDQPAGFGIGAAGATGDAISTSGGGGGGGGGYYGGGGGSTSSCAGNGGGGGGSGYGPTGVRFESGVHAGDGLVILTYTLDTTAPVIRPTIVGTVGSNGWYVSAVTVNFTCSEEAGGSGLATNTVMGATLPHDGADQSLTNTGECSDKAGNSATPVTVSNINIDKTAPVVAVTGVSNGASYTLGSVPTAGCTTSDETSGVATQATIAVTGGNADNTGAFTATCSGATDKAGNSAAPVSVTYTVAYKWMGFAGPVNNPPAGNTANAGQAISLKFSLGGNFGLNIFASGYPASQPVNCSTGGSTGPLTPITTPGNSGLQYDAKTQTYTYVWKTDKAWAGTCRQLIVKLMDGTQHTALFQFNGQARSAAADGAVAVTQQIFLPVVNR